MDIYFSDVPRYQKLERGLEHLKVLVLLSSSAIMPINVLIFVLYKRGSWSFIIPMPDLSLCIFTHPTEVSDLRARDQILLTNKQLRSMR